MYINQKGDSSAILIVVIVFMLILGGGYFVYQNQKSFNPDKTNMESTSSSSPSVTQSQDSPLKEYSNTNLGFRFSYNGDLEITEKENNVPESGLIYELSVDNPKFSDNKTYLELAVNKDTAECPVKSSDLKNPKTSEMVVDGKQSQLIEGEGAYSTHRRSLCVEDNNNNLFWFVSDYPLSSPDNVKVEKNKQFDQILVSLRFAPAGQAENINSFPEGQSCGRNAGAAGDAKCAAGLICKYETPQDEENGVGVCAKP